MSIRPCSREGRADFRLGRRTIEVSIEARCIGLEIAMLNSLQMKSAPKAITIPEEPAMNASFQPCHYCESTKIPEGPIGGARFDALNDVYICQECGLVYKPFLNPNDKFEYPSDAWARCLDSHSERIRLTAEWAMNRINLQKGDAVLDVGMGPGILYDVLRPQLNGARYIGIEPVTAIAEDVKVRNPDIAVLNTSVNEVAIPESSFKMIFCLGVDYLFADIRAAFENIARWMTDDAMLVVSRNVFIEQTSFVGQAIKSRQVLFESNILLRNWFHVPQYKSFLEQFFTVVDVQRGANPGEGSEKELGFFVNYLCSAKASSSGQTATNSYYEKSIELLSGLRDDPRKSPSGGRSGKKAIWMPWKR